RARPRRRTPPTPGGRGRAASDAEGRAAAWSGSPSKRRDGSGPCGRRNGNGTQGTRREAAGAFPTRFIVIDAEGRVKKRSWGERTPKGGGATAQGGKRWGFARPRHLCRHPPPY